ncbi:MAG: hypothetical protein ACFHWZ_18080 [Phycisphaerales bacterium]
MGVDVLAIESNYCRDMQVASDRPEFLKSRIMDGSGHLSNDECLDAVHAISPRARGAPAPVASVQHPGSRLARA